MKNVKLFRILSVVIFLSLLLIASPAAPAKAARGLTLSPTEGTVGARITITGTEFNKSTADTDKYAAIYFASEEATTLDDIGSEVIYYKLVNEGVWLDQDGDFETTFRVPEVLDDGSRDEDVTSGTYYVYVCHYSGTTIAPRIRAVATFTVTMGEISLYPSRGKVGTELEIDGINFAANKSITFKYDGNAVPISSGNKQTSSQGKFTSVIRIQESSAGSHTVSATVSGDEATATFNVEPEIVITPTSGKAQTTVIISGTGFGKLKAVTVWFYGTAIATATTNILGSFYANFNVPDRQAGIYSVDAEEGANIAKAKFTITVPPPQPTPPPTPTPPPPPPSPAISISAATGSIGQGVVMGGSAFKADTTVTIKYDNELLNAVTTDSNGVFAAAFTVPVSKYGNHTITASDGTNTSEVVFAVESTPPPVPSLLLPQTGGKVTTPIRFDWRDVTDDSPPITYTFQIATSPDFSTASTVLEKTGLTKTEYSVTEEESLRLGIGEKPYYWRVRAIDGASNEGNWANTGTFYVVSSGMPTWTIIVIAILGGIFLLALGFFINMKTSPSRR
ncbi:IPT/TIG domain-containing protein [Chloroflexota bacterium]